LWLAIGIFLIWGAFMAALAGITLVFPGTWLDRIWVLNPAGHAGLMALPKPVRLLFPVLALALLCAGVSWLKRRFWGWMLAAVLVAGNLIGDLARLAQGDWLGGSVGVAVAGALLFYIARPGTRSFFRSHL
jgi:hypothetical protein